MIKIYTYAYVCMYNLNISDSYINVYQQNALTFPLAD